MSNATPPAAPDRRADVVIVSHSMFFYWWPMWAVGFLMAALTFMTGDRVAFVPEGTEAKSGVKIDGVPGTRDALIAPDKTSLPREGTADALLQPHMRMTVSNNPGVIWAVTLCLLVLLTHVQLRGVWSLISILVIVMATILLAYAGLWDTVLRSLRIVDIHISGSGYLAISIYLFLLWLVTFLLYDRREYMVFSRGQLRVRKAMGIGETVFDTRGMVVQRHRDAFFRHWILGFGSGDLTVNTAGTSPQRFEMPNVLAIDRKLNLINTMLQEREVVKAR